MKNEWIVLCIVAAFVIGIGAGFYLDSPATVTVENEVIKYVDRNVTVKEYVEVNNIDDLLDNSVEVFLEDLEEEEEVWCKGDEYDIEEVEVRKVYDEYIISYDDEDQTIDLKVKLKFDDGDDKCYKTYDVNVFYEEDETPEVSY